MISVTPERHDELVAIVSHVPHLAAAALMGVASSAAEEHATLLRLAAGGFRDMTRIAAGHPSMWLDICDEKPAAIVKVLGTLIDELDAMRRTVDTSDRTSLQRMLARARSALVNLPTGAPPAEQLVEVWVPIPDRPASSPRSPRWPASCRSTSTTSRSRTIPRAGAAHWCSWSTKRSVICCEAGCSPAVPSVGVVAGGA